MAREITPAARKAVGKYEAANYDKVLLRMPKGNRDEIKAAADASGKSLNQYILDAVRAKMVIEEDRDGNN